MRRLVLTGRVAGLLLISVSSCSAFETITHQPRVLPLPVLPSGQRCLLDSRRSYPGRRTQNTRATLPSFRPRGGRQCTSSARTHPTHTQCCPTGCNVRARVPPRITQQLQTRRSLGELQQPTQRVRAPWRTLHACPDRARHVPNSRGFLPRSHKIGRAHV